MRISVSRAARRVIRSRGGDLYIWEAGGRVRAGTAAPPSEEFEIRPADGFVLHVDRTLASPLGVHVGLRPWLQPFVREGARGGSVVWRAVAVETHIPDGGTGTP